MAPLILQRSVPEFFEVGSAHGFHPEASELTWQKFLIFPIQLLTITCHLSSIMTHEFGQYLQAIFSRVWLTSDTKE